MRSTQCFCLIIFRKSANHAVKYHDSDNGGQKLHCSKSGVQKLSTAQMTEAETRMRNDFANFAALKSFVAELFDKR